MSRRRPSRISDRAPLVACLLAVGLGVFADLPADATGHSCFGRSLFIRVAGRPSERGENDSTATAMASPVSLRARRETVVRNNGLGSGAIASTGIRDTGVTHVSRGASSARPTVTILTPADQATVPAGTLRVRGIVSANGAKVRVVVNDVRAFVREGTFTARVPVSVNTMLLTAVATTAKGASARHQIGLTVRDTVESALRLRPFSTNGAPPTRIGLSLRSAPVASAPTGDVDGEGESDPAGSCGEEQGVAAPSAEYESTPATAPSGAAEATATAHLPSPVAADDHLPWRSRSLTVEPRRATIGRTVEVLFAHTGEGSRADSALLMQRGFLTQIAADIASLRLTGNREGTVVPSPHGMRSGNEYSFVVLFVLGADGLWRVWWF